jgi:HlyD family secretion protein
VSRGPMTVGVTDDGVTRAKDVFVVSAPVTGYLSRIELEAGDQVKRGALITTMTGIPASPLDQRSRDELRSALASSEAAAASAQASLTQAQSDLARTEELAKRGFMAKAQLEAARTRVATGEASVAQGKAEAARVRALLRQPAGPASGPAVPVRAPASGAVLTPLMTIGDPHDIEAVVDLLSRDAVRVKPGDRVEFSQWGGGSPLVGKVERIEPFGRLKVSALGIEEQRVNVIVDFEGASKQQAERLGHGYQFDATIILWSFDSALRVPISALFRGSDGGWRVFVVADGRARERAVKLGHMTDEFAEVMQGLSEGEEVIVSPSSALQDGTSIQAR